MWLAFNAPHLPRHLPPTNLLVSAKYLALSGTAQDISANGRAYWEAMVQAEDTEIGRLLKVVDTNDTDIIFIGDNGSEIDVQQFPYKNAAVPATTSGNGHAKFTIYEDDNETYNYEKGQRATYDLVWNDKAKTLTVGERQGSFPGMVATRKLNIVLASDGKPTPTHFLFPKNKGFWNGYTDD